MNSRRILILSIIGGVLITVVTGLIVNTPSELVGAVHYGYPLPWLVRLVVAPEFFPWRIEFLGLVADVIVWALIIGLILMLLIRTKK